MIDARYQKTPFRSPSRSTTMNPFIAIALGSVMLTASVFGSTYSWQDPQAIHS